jgi:prepilin-type N-terminal cleavage/methylation domain-containing protein
MAPRRQTARHRNPGSHHVNLASANRNRGFSLVEMLTTLSVLAILAVIAVPSFTEMRQRAAIRGAADATLAFWNDARFEAIKRNQLVKVGVYVADDGQFCLGAATTEDPADATVCDCRANAPAADACNVARYPADPSEWNGTTLSALDLGGGALDDARPAIIEPMRTSLTEAADAGALTLSGPTGPGTYRLTLAVDRLGRGHVCEPADATDTLPDYASRRCAE